MRGSILVYSIAKHNFEEFPHHALGYPWLHVCTQCCQISLTKSVVYVCSTRTMKPSHSVSHAIQDHSFDALTNIVGLGAALLANQFYWWIDPVGAMVLAVYTIYEWSRTVLENAGTCCRLQLKL